MSKKQTAVEKLAEMISYTSKDTYNIMVESGFINQAFAMEREQKCDFANEYADAVMGGCVKRAEQYYDQTYGKESE